MTYDRLRNERRIVCILLALSGLLCILKIDGIASYDWFVVLLPFLIPVFVALFLIGFVVLLVVFVFTLSVPLYLLRNVK